MEVNNQLYAPATLPARERALISIEQEVGGAQSRSGLFGKEKIFLPLSEAKSSIFMPREFLSSNASNGYCNTF